MNKNDKILNFRGRCCKCGAWDVILLDVKGEVCAECWFVKVDKCSVRSS